jgi:NAD(P)H-flavin reductase
MQLTPYTEFSEKNQLDDANCIRCSTCIKNCPAGILTLATEETAGVIEHLTPLTGYERRSRIDATIHSITQLQDDVVEYTFRVTQPEGVEYYPGEFILVRIQAEPEEMFRAYSISSYNRDNKHLSVTIKKAPNGYGTDIVYNTFKEGDPVVLEGPMGRELRVDPHAEHVLLVGGGIGITPFLPIVTDLTQNPTEGLQQVKLIYGVNTPEEFLYKEEFEHLEQASPLFDFLPTVAFDESWEGHKGFVTSTMESIDHLSKYKIYMCGPQPMITASIKKLSELGVPRENIFYESA